MTVGKYVMSNACSSGEGELPNCIRRQLEVNPPRNFICTLHAFFKSVYSND